MRRTVALLAAALAVAYLAFVVESTDFPHANSGMSLHTRRLTPGSRYHQKMRLRAQVQRKVEYDRVPLVAESYDVSDIKVEMVTPHLAKVPVAYFTSFLDIHQILSRYSRFIAADRAATLALKVLLALGCEVAAPKPDEVGLPLPPPAKPVDDESVDPKEMEKLDKAPKVAHKTRSKITLPPVLADQAKHLDKNLETANVETADKLLRDNANLKFAAADKVKCPELGHELGPERALRVAKFLMTFLHEVRHLFLVDKAGLAYARAAIDLADAPVDNKQRQVLVSQTDRQTVALTELLITLDHKAAGTNAKILNALFRKPKEDDKNLGFSGLHGAELFTSLLNLIEQYLGSVSSTVLLATEFRAARVPVPPCLADLKYAKDELYQALQRASDCEGTGLADQVVKLLPVEKDPKAKVVEVETEAMTALKDKAGEVLKNMMIATEFANRRQVLHFLTRFPLYTVAKRKLDVWSASAKKLESKEFDVLVLDAKVFHIFLANHWRAVLSVIYGTNILQHNTAPCPCPCDPSLLIDALKEDAKKDEKKDVKEALLKPKKAPPFTMQPADEAELKKLDTFYGITPGADKGKTKPSTPPLSPKGGDAAKGKDKKDLLMPTCRNPCEQATADEVGTVCKFNPEFV